jgi:hypothetical protein
MDIQPNNDENRTLGSALAERTIDEVGLEAAMGLLLVAVARALVKGIRRGQEHADLNKATAHKLVLGLWKAIDDATADIKERTTAKTPKQVM